MCEHMLQQHITHWQDCYPVLPLMRAKALPAAPHLVCVCTAGSRSRTPRLTQTAHSSRRSVCP